MPESLKIQEQHRRYAKAPLADQKIGMPKDLLEACRPYDYIDENSFEASGVCRKLSSYLSPNFTVRMLYGMHVDISVASINLPN